MKLYILISTIDEGIKKIKNILKEPQKNIIYIVSHQYQDKKYKYIPKELLREDILVSQIKGKGLSKNRNNAISLVNNGICLVADDDINILPNSFNIIIDTFKKNEDLDVACFKIKTEKNQPEYKNYPKNCSLVKKIKDKKYYVSSVEIAFRVNSIKKNKIFFNENFGIGSNIMIGGEEKVFINDCIKKNLKIMFFPYYIVQHPFLSNIKKIRKYDNKKIILNGGLDAETIGKLSILKALLVTIYKIPSLLKNSINPFKYLAKRLFGAFYILKNKQKK